MYEGSTSANYSILNFSNHSDPDINISCYEFTAHQVYSVTVAKPVVAAIGAVACLLAVVIILTLKQYKKFVNRLVLYMMIIGCIHAVTIGLEVAPVYHKGQVVAVRKGLNGLCEAVGFVTQTTAWMFFTVMLWIVLYLFFLAVFKYGANRYKHEVAGILISVLFPLSFNWVPFVQRMYGLAGVWCWIRLTNGYCWHDYTQGVIYQFALLYGPLTLLILISFVLFVVMVCVLCRQRIYIRGASIYHSSHHQAIKEALPLLVYPLIYDVICTLMTANRIYYAITVYHGRDPYFPLWFIHSVIDPCRTLVPPLAFILHPNTLKRICCRCKKRPPVIESSDLKSSATAYIVSKEYPYTETDPLIIGARKYYDDNSDDERFQSLFEGRVQ